MSKKTKRIIVIIVMVLVIIFLIDLGKKAYIISKFNDHCREYSNATNVYRKMNETDNTRVEFWKKDNVALLQRTSEDGKRIIYYGEDYNWIIIDTVDSEGKENKHAVKIPKRENDLIIPSEASVFYTEDFFTTLIMAFASKITTEEVNGVECYRIYIDEDVQVYVSTDGFEKIREINGSTDTGYITYRFNVVTDENVSFPNLDGFNIVEGE